MPLIATSALPSFERLRREGNEVLSPEHARCQDIRELHIGLLNMMPDAVLEATERQFMRLIGSCNRIAQFNVHLFTIDGIPHMGKFADHVARFYETFADIKRDGLDALIISGANPVKMVLSEEPFWGPLIEVMGWAREHVCSTLYSCLATHAALQHYHGHERVKLPNKRWGVYSHRVTGIAHPLLANVNTRIDGPHSHIFDMPRELFEAAGQPVLIDSEEAGVYLAVSDDMVRSVYFQGHPEYDINSLFKEYKREVNRFINREREDYPPFPQHYFYSQAAAMLDEYRDSVEAVVAVGADVPELDESVVAPWLDNTWTDSGKALFNNWLGMVYQLTHLDRDKPFIDGVNPNDPLGLASET